MSQNNKKKILAQDWFNKAGEDELSSEVLLKEGGAPSTLCFLSQQMAEKYLKGLLIFYNQEVEKIHDIVKLANLLKDRAPDIADYQDELTLLSRYYVETRYPGDWPEGFSVVECKQAFEAAKRIKEFVLKKIKDK